MIVGISHKAYFGYQQTQQWCEAVAAMLRQPALARAPVELFTFPAMPTLPVALCAFADTRMATGAQNVCEAPAGADRETSASLLQEMGCRYVEIGHAERRRHFGETVAVINRKIDMAFANGLTPVICIGEEQRMSASEAAAFALEQAQALLAHRPLPLASLILHGSRSGPSARRSPLAITLFATSAARCAMRCISALASSAGLSTAVAPGRVCSLDCGRTPTVFSLVAFPISRRR